MKNIIKASAIILGIAKVCFELFVFAIVAIAVFEVFFLDDTTEYYAVAEEKIVDTVDVESYGEPETQSFSSDSITVKEHNELKGNGEDTVTIMVYMNGADLESYDGSASDDLQEMMSATLSDNVNLIVQTGGTSEWHTSGISADRTQRFQIKDNSLNLVDDSLSQLDMTSSQTLLDFITYCSTNYTADRYFLILWNHGGGAAYGYGYDEIVGEDSTMYIDEFASAVNMSGVNFDMIGFDACLMGGLETAYLVSSYTDYYIGSEDFESGYGWEYSNWLTALGENSSLETSAVGKIIVDDFVVESEDGGDEGILSLYDESFVPVLFEAWTEFTNANSSTLYTTDYSIEMNKSSRAIPALREYKSKGFLTDIIGAIIGEDDDYTISDYSCCDIANVANVFSDETSENVLYWLSYSIVYTGATDGDSNMTGMSVTLPYSDDTACDNLVYSLENMMNVSETYIEFLSGFNSYSSDDYSEYNWDNSDISWEDFNSYSNDYVEENDYSYDFYEENTNYDDYSYDDSELPYLESWEYSESVGVYYYDDYEYYNIYFYYADTDTLVAYDYYYEEWYQYDDSIEDYVEIEPVAGLEELASEVLNN